jgi:hypothetical protein
MLMMSPTFSWQFLYLYQEDGKPTEAKGIQEITTINPAEHNNP